MLLFEHEGKAVLREHGIATPRGAIAERPTDITAAAKNLSPPFMIKAQVLTGGRGKAGGIRPAADLSALGRAAEAMLGATIREFPIHAVLVEERAAVAHERYMAALLDGEDMLLVLGRKGGIEVEELFCGERDGFQTIRIDPLFGLGTYQVRQALEQLEIPTQMWAAYSFVAERLANLFRQCDATLAEINPLAELEDGSLLALDARIAIDDGALFRQPRFAELANARSTTDDLAARMRALEVQYVPIGGNIGLVSSGAGVGTALMDWVASEGCRLHSFVDLDYAIMSGRTDDGMQLVLDTLIDDRAVKAIIVNFTTCGLRLDAIARSLVRVLDERRQRLRCLVLIHLQGNRAPIGQGIVREAGYEVVERLGDAVRKAVRTAGEARA